MMIRSQSGEAVASISDSRSHHHGKRERYEEDSGGEVDSAQYSEAMNGGMNSLDENGEPRIHSSKTDVMPAGMNMAMSLTSEPMLAHAQSLCPTKTNQNIFKKTRFGDYFAQGQRQRLGDLGASYPSAPSSASSSSSAAAAAAAAAAASRISGAGTGGSAGGIARAEMRSANEEFEYSRSKRPSGSDSEDRSRRRGREEEFNARENSRYVDDLDLSRSPSLEYIKSRRVCSFGEEVTEELLNRQNTDPDPEMRNRNSNSDSARKRVRLYQIGEYLSPSSGEYDDGLKWRDRDVGRPGGDLGTSLGDSLLGHSSADDTDANIEAQSSSASHVLHALAPAELVGPPSAKYIQFLQEAYSSTHQLLLKEQQESAQTQRNHNALVMKLTETAVSLENQNKVLKKGMLRADTKIKEVSHQADTKIKEMTHQLYCAHQGALALQQAGSMLEETQHLRQENAHLRDVLANAATYISGLEHTISELRETIDRGGGGGGGGYSDNFNHRPDIC